MAADPFSTKNVRDITHHLARLATATERIADALDQMNANDPLTAIGKALEAETQSTPQEVDPLAHIPEGERYRFRS
jgi:hypothetical protein